MIIGLWNSGIPYTIGYIKNVTKYYSSSEKLNIIYFFCNFLDATGTILHHTSSSYITVGLCIGSYKLTKELSSVLMPLLIQHSFTLVKHYNYYIYCVVEMLLEIWWQHEFFTVFEHFILMKDKYYDFLGPAMASSMILSHYMYFIAGFLRFFIHINNNINKN